MTSGFACRDATFGFASKRSMTGCSCTTVPLSESLQEVDENYNSVYKRREFDLASGKRDLRKN